MSLVRRTPPTDPSGYEHDIYAWSRRQAELLRDGRFAEADWPNIIEEIESVGGSQRRALKSSYRLVITHLLKWQFQREKRSRSWKNTIGRERGTIQSDERDNPSLAADANAIIGEIYSIAARDAARETGLPLATFPPTCPYSLDFLRDHDAMPE